MGGATTGFQLRKNGRILPQSNSHHLLLKLLVMLIHVSNSCCSSFLNFTFSLRPSRVGLLCLSLEGGGGKKKGKIITHKVRQTKINHRAFHKQLFLHL